MPQTLYLTLGGPLSGWGSIRMVYNSGNDTWSNPDPLPPLSGCDGTIVGTLIVLWCLNGYWHLTVPFGSGPNNYLLTIVTPVVSCEPLYLIGSGTVTNGNPLGGGACTGLVIEGEVTE